MVKRQPPRRTSSNFAGIDAGERTRWGMGLIIVVGEYEAVRGGGGAAITPWASWDEWARCYGACREDFLRWYAVRHPGETPASEALFEAYEKGLDPSEAELPVVMDYRPVLAGRRPVPMGEKYW